MKWAGIYVAVGLLILLALFCTTLHGQTNDALPVASRPIADYLSTAIASTTVGIDATVSLHTGYVEHRVKAALLCEGLKYGIANGSSLILKHYIHEERPDGSDDQSFPSEHTANAFAATGWNVSMSLPLAVVVGELRTEADRHYWHDVFAGAALGLLSRFITTRIPGCKGLT